MAIFCGEIETEFIDCEQTSISYDSRGIATINLTVVSPNGTLRGKYNDLTIGGVHFTGVTVSVDGTPIEGSTAHDFKIVVIAAGN